MITDLFSKVFGGKFAAKIFFLSALATSLLATGNVQGEEIAVGGLSLNETSYQGTVNSVHPDSFRLIIDDRSFILDRVLLFRGASSSREQVIQHVEPGSIVKLSLGALVAPRSGSRSIQRITVINQ